MEEAYSEAEAKNADIIIFKSKRLDNNTGVITSCTFSLYLDKLPSQLPFSIEEVKGNFFRFIMGWAWDKLFNRDFIESNDIRFQEQRTTNDLYFTYISVVEARRISTIDKELYTQRINVPTSLSMTRYKSWDCFSNALIKLKNKLIQICKWNITEGYYFDYALHCCLMNFRLLKKTNESYLLFFKILNDLELLDSKREYFTCPSEVEEYEEIRRIFIDLGL